MNWKKVDKDFVLVYGDFVFRLQYREIGTYAMGRAYVLQVRRKDESKFHGLGYVFWTVSDGGYDNWKELSVDNKLWKNEREILKRVEQILADLQFLEE